ncbi:MAG: MupA/Atu3671 family FMN-dependent luciferase-like monooxygenase [Saprospiraceae bacterium]
MSEQEKGNKIEALGGKSIADFSKLFNATAQVYAKDEHIITLFENQVRQQPQATALVFEDQTLDYQILQEQVNQLTQALSLQGVKSGTTIGLCLRRNLQMPVAILAILKTGATCLPITIDTPIRQLDFLCESGEMNFLLVEKVTCTLFRKCEGLSILELENLQSTDKVVPNDLNSLRTKTEGAEERFLYFSLAQKRKTLTNANIQNLFLGLNQSFPPSEKQETWLAQQSIDTEESIIDLLWNLCRGSKIILQPAANVALNGTKPMNCSLFYFAAQEEITTENKYRLLLEGAKFADENDLAAVWIPERHFHSFGDQFPNPSVAAAAVAVVTQKIKLRSGSVVLPLHDPIRVAEEWAMVDHLSEGRVEISFASGWNPNDFIFAPDAYQQRHQVMCDNLKVVHQLWRGESCTRTNGKGEKVTLSIHPKPIQPTLPTWITSGGSPETFRYAGSIGANILTLLWGQPKEELKAKIEIYRTALAKHGFDPERGQVAIMLHSFIGENFTEVKPTVKEPLKNYIRHSIALMQGKSNDGLDEEVEKLVEASFTHHYHTNGLFGTPETCLSYLQELTLLGVNEIACLIDFGISNDTTLANLPQLKKLEDLVKRTAAQQSLLAELATKHWTTKGLVQEHQVTHLYTTVASLAPWQNGIEDHSWFRQLTTLIVSGEILSEATRQWISKYGAQHNYFLYGAPELSTVNMIERLATQEEKGSCQLLANQLGYLLDDQQALVAFGVVGDLWIGGDGVTSSAKGTRESISFDLGNDRKEPLYKTATQAKVLPDGTLQLIASTTSAVYRQGKKIDLELIQKVLNQHVQVSSSLVTAPTLESGTQRIVAYFTGPENLTTQQLRFFLTYHLPTYYLPTLFVKVDQLPSTPISIDKYSDNALPLGTAYLAPRNDTETQLATLWSEILEMPSEKIGIDDSFFALGANTFDLSALQRSLEKNKQWRIEKNTIYQKDTIRGLSTLYLKAMAENENTVPEKEDSVDLFENNLNLFNEA